VINPAFSFFVLAQGAKGGSRSMAVSSGTKTEAADQLVSLVAFSHGR
jgi:hypothetical protein